jgi:hypothetical protein
MLTSLRTSGEYKDWFGSNDCIPCPLYMTSLEASVSLAQCSCQAGYEPALPPSPNSSSPTPNASCVACELGKFKDEHGNSSCASCPNGTYANVSAMSACNTCPDGSTSLSADGISSVLDCHCKAGYFQGNNVSSAREGPLKRLCIACLPGTFKVRAAALYMLFPSALLYSHSHART